MKVERREEREWLQRHVGEWSYEAEASMGRGSRRRRPRPNTTGDGPLAKYQDAVEAVGDDRGVLRSRVLGGGRWREFMTAHYRRRTGAMLGGSAR